MNVVSKRKILCSLFAAVLLIFALFFTAACGGAQPEEQAYIVSFEKTDSDGVNDVYTITYSDGTTSQFTVTNGTDELTVS